jgi:hypothetical protein
VGALASLPSCWPRAPYWQHQQARDCGIGQHLVLPGTCRDEPDRQQDEDEEQQQQQQQQRRQAAGERQNVVDVSDQLKAAARVRRAQCQAAAGLG